MGPPRLDAQSEAIASATRQVDAERRTWAFSAQLTLANLAFGLAPLVPRSSAIFGVLTVPRALACIVPGQLAVWVSVWLHRRGGSGSRAYRVSEGIETFLLYTSMLGIVFFSGVRWTPVWGLAPFTSIFWGLTKPFLGRVYQGIILGAHGLLTVAFALRGDPWGAAIAVAVGVAASMVFEGTARPARDRILAEADRDLARAQVNEAVLDAERERIARSLTASVADRLAVLSDRLSGSGAEVSSPRRKASEQVRHALVELRAIAEGRSAAAVPASFGGLAEWVERKVRPLCVDARYEQTLRGARSLALDGSTALAVLRIVQELVRNAITHGAARRVSVELSHQRGELSVRVQDDGRGLRSERLSDSTGGLRNAQRWSAELGGSFERLASPSGVGTLLRVRLPVGETGEA